MQGLWEGFHPAILPLAEPHETHTGEKPSRMLPLWEDLPGALVAEDARADPPEEKPYQCNHWETLPHEHQPERAQEDPRGWLYESPPAGRS